jgi:DNA invertase Pin-like site-specific DNA recombinase
MHHDLTQRRITLVSVIDSIDTSTDEGMMHFQLKGMVSEFQAKQTGRKIRSALKYKAGQGERLGPPPFGYSRADKGIIPNADAPSSSAFSSATRPALPRWAICRRI